MNLTKAFVESGSRFAQGVQTPTAERSKTMGNEVYSYMRLLRTRLFSSTTYEASQTPLSTWRLEGSTTIEVTNQETFDGRPTPRTKGTPASRGGFSGRGRNIAGPPGRGAFRRTVRAGLLRFYAKAYRRLKSWQEGEAGTLVYDIINAGPRHRFATANSIAVNCSLGLGYGMGHVKFRTTADTMFRLKLEPERAFSLVQEFRANNPEVVRFWYAQQDALRLSAMRKDPTHIVILPSGRRLVYWDPHLKVSMDEVTGKPRQRLYASVVKGMPPYDLWGGKLAENASQATARDIMYAGALAVYKKHPNWWFLWNAYDEVVFEVPDQEVAIAERVLPHELCHAATDTWARGCPMAVDGGVYDRYPTKD